MTVGRSSTGTSPSPSPSSPSPSPSPTTSFWAVDSSGERELDPQLKAAQRFAHKEYVDGTTAQQQQEEEGSDDGGRQDTTTASGPLLDGPIVLRNLLTGQQIDTILEEASRDGVWPRGLYKQEQQKPQQEKQQQNQQQQKQQENTGEDEQKEDDPAGSSGPTTDEEEEEEEEEQSPPPAATPTATVPSSSPSNKTAIGESTVGSRNDLTTQQQQQQLLLLQDAPHHYAWTNKGHVVLYMHNQNHWFVRTLTKEWGVIRGGMEAREWMNGGIPEIDPDFLGTGQEAADDPSMSLVRTVELHHYGPGGGLTTPGHRDTGSELTISVLLSDSQQVEGGDFVTYTPNGQPVAHRMDRGDAILFNSMSLHNISTVTAGLRKSLVVELWPTNRCPP